MAPHDLGDMIRLSLVKLWCCSWFHASKKIFQLKQAVALHTKLSKLCQQVHESTEISFSKGCVQEHAIQKVKLNASVGFCK